MIYVASLCRKSLNFSKRSGTKPRRNTSSIGKLIAFVRITPINFAAARSTSSETSGASTSLVDAYCTSQPCIYMSPRTDIDLTAKTMPPIILDSKSSIRKHGENTRASRLTKPHPIRIPMSLLRRSKLPSNRWHHTLQNPRHRGIPGRVCLTQS